MAHETSPGQVIPQASNFWTIVICAIAQNIVLGFGYGSFGPLLAANEAHFGIGRVSASAGMSLLSLAVGLIGPLAGSLFVRRSVKAWMIFGACLSAVSYPLLAVATNYTVALVAYAMIGASMAFTALVGPTTLVSRLVSTGRGRALAFVNLPVILFVAPFAIGELGER